MIVRVFFNSFSINAFICYLRTVRIKTIGLKKYKMEVVIQDNLPDTEVTEYQTEFRKVPEANLFNCKITTATR